MIETKQRASSVPSSQQRIGGKFHWQVIEPSVWEFIVHKEFEVQISPDFEAVRVPVPVSSHRQVISCGSIQSSGCSTQHVVRAVTDRSSLAMIAVVDELLIANCAVSPDTLCVFDASDLTDLRPAHYCCSSGSSDCHGD